MIWEEKCTYGLGISARYAPVEGTSVPQAFDLNIGRTGLGEAEARKLGYNVVISVSIRGYDAACMFERKALNQVVFFRVEPQ